MDAEKRNVGILTFNRALNYGAVLQAYAMKTVCEKIGYNAHVVNYWPTPEVPNKSVKRLKTRITAKKIKHTAKTAASAVYMQKKIAAFLEFRKHWLSESEECISARQIEALGYDAYIIGSDQIWNYNITGGRLNPIYFGGFAVNAQKVIYAGSAHDTPFPLDFEKRFTSMLLKTSAEISIREQKLADYVEKLTGIKHPVVLDPTLLAGRDLLDQLTQGQPVETEPYILIYQIDKNPYSDISVKTLESAFRCKTYTMTLPRIGSIHGRRGTASPEEFLTLLKNAKMVITNSFHGIALSLLYEKQFFVYEHSGVMTRIDSLLDLVGLEDRKVRLVSDIDISKTIDYDSVNQRLVAARHYSLNYLKGALNGISFAQEGVQNKQTKLSEMRQRTKSECSGCTACAHACPVNAISMRADKEGFLYPIIDENVCIHCGLCDSFCGFLPKQNSSEYFEESYAYGVKHKNDAIRNTSRSGAAFIALSDQILQKGGVVYGAAFTDHFQVEHIRAVDAEERDRMKNAKYVQSNLGNTYKNAELDLSEGKYVLYSGTPCQISGLLAYLKVKNTDTTRLYTCDLVCHGTPSPEIWSKYVYHIEKKYKSRILDASFRDKSFGWASHCESFVLENGKKIVSRDYTDMFYSHIMFRPSCHNCCFANTKRVADITLGDFWGIEKHSPSFNDNRGVSLVLVNTPKGKALFENAENEFEIIRCKLEKCMQPTLVKPSSASVLRDDFWKDYLNMNFSSLLKKYTKPAGKPAQIKRELKQVLYHLHIRKHP